MKRIFIFVIACLFFQAATLYGKQIVQWNEAHNHYGELITVKGKIVSTYNSGKACFFNFHPDYKKYFSAVIFRSDFGQFPPNPEDYYYGKEVKVTGVIKEYKGKPEIIIKYKSQIKIIENYQSTPNIPKVISWKDAGQYYGNFVTVEGKVVAIYNSGKACFLNFHRNWKKYFTAVIFSQNFHKFKTPPEINFLNKNVQVTGFVKEYKGKPEIIINNPSQIKIIQTTPISKNPKKKNDGIPSYVTRPAGSVPCKPLKSVSKIQPNEDTGQWEIVDPKSLGETDEMPSYIKKLTCSVPPIKDLLIARYLVDRWIDIECINSAEFEKIVGMLL